MSRSLHTFIRFVVGILAVAAAQPTLASLHESKKPEPTRVEEIILSLPKLPIVKTLIGLEPSRPKGRSHYLPLVTREAERRGLPPAVADAVVMIESTYDPSAVGGVGELGLMQVRPGTAAMLGFNGSNEALADPETNIRYGVEYLAQAWRLAGGDLCRALIKYRAGHGEERMTPRSVEYCRKARVHLATIGSPLAHAEVSSDASAGSVQIAPIQPVQQARDPRVVAEEQRRTAVQRELVRRFILSLTKVGSEGKIEPVKQTSSQSSGRKIDAGFRASRVLARR